MLDELPPFLRGVSSFNAGIVSQSYPAHCPQQTQLISCDPVVSSRSLSGGDNSYEFAAGVTDDSALNPLRRARTERSVRDSAK